MSLYVHTLYRVYSTLPNSRVLPQVLLSDAFVVLALQAGKASLFSHDVGVFWLLVRLLACGATGLMIWVASTGQLQKKRSIEVRRTTDSFLQTCSCCWPVVVGTGHGIALGVSQASRASYRIIPTTSCPVCLSPPQSALPHTTPMLVSSSFTNSLLPGSSRS